MGQLHPELSARRKFMRLCILVLTYGKVTVEPTSSRHCYVHVDDVELHGAKPIYHHQTWKIEVWLKMKRVVAMEHDGSISPFNKRAAEKITRSLQTLVPLEALAEI
jgi:hypothetical protein